ncbi:MAG: 5-amino-6-(D-ribitylamino)uracil--L-tyrosine 4-hydroxyphenyl transferase CofH [Legionellaceae bacterium]|nr:5-amino-6-(D-ribitylamino)uracil--L-tyrosine 4-hydroxyphenyl transferase CofH [Legionellaceae bacterium]
MTLFSDKEILDMAYNTSLSSLLETASLLRDQGHGQIISYSKKVFIPLTYLCRDVCHYCTFAKTPKFIKSAYLSPEEVLSIAKAGVRAGCHEALFTLGDKPELRYRAAQDELKKLGYSSTIHYLEAMCKLVLQETELLPHVNPGIMTEDDLQRLRKCSISQGIMLESSAQRLCERGGPHFGSPDKNPTVRLKTIRDAGIQKIPFTTGILIGIGETRDERIMSLLSLRALHQEYGHLQEIIVQNFRAKKNTKMANSPEPDLDDFLWTIALARIIFGPSMNIQAPPNLSPETYSRLIEAGINDWGGISPVTPDHVNPEAAWPEITRLEANTALAGKTLVQRLASYPRYCQEAFTWHTPELATRILRLTDTEGLVRADSWSPGVTDVKPPVVYSNEYNIGHKSQIGTILDGVLDFNKEWNEEDIVQLFRAYGPDLNLVCHTADQLRQQVNQDIVRYVVNRNINYTNVCYYKCKFCSFSKGKTSEFLRDAPYVLNIEEITRRATEAWNRGATEVCLQGGIHPNYTGETYLEICRAIRSALPHIHIHAFSPLEIWQGAHSLNIPIGEFLMQLRQAGLNTLPGTAAEILCDDIRQTLCPDKINSAQWLSVMESAHSVGLKTTATIMFGHMEQTRHWAQHLLKIRALHIKTGGFTEFVPLPFIHMKTPLYNKGLSRKGPTFREVILMHAVSRLVLHPHITNIQASWTKLGDEGVKYCLQAGVNDLGGTLMNESISKAAGAQHGQEMSPEKMDAIIRSIGRHPEQRTTLYQKPSMVQTVGSYAAAPLQTALTTPKTSDTKKREGSCQ